MIQLKKILLIMGSILYLEGQMDENGTEKAGNAPGNNEKLFEILVSKSVVMRPLVRTRRG